MVGLIDLDPELRSADHLMQEHTTTTEARDTKGQLLGVRLIFYLIQIPLNYSYRLDSSERQAHKQK